MKKLHLSSGESFSGTAFGADTDCLGEVVFTTGMTGYLETLTDPSYYGQIVVFTFPLIGNYGVFDPKQVAKDVDETYESQQIWVKGVVLTEWSEAFSHCQAWQNFNQWLQKNNIPALGNVDTRALTQTLREHGCIMGNIGEAPVKDFSDTLNGRYVPKVSPSEVTMLEPTKGDIGKTVAFVDCGAKNGIFRNFLERGVQVIRFPFDQNPFESDYDFDGLFFSNGPGDPETVTETIQTMKDALKRDKPIFGICLGNQMLALAAGGQTEKMKYGHRGVNQPVEEVDTRQCLVTTQNHGFVVAEPLPNEFEVWFKNLNDGSIEGIKHKTKPVFAAQFHPEACAGPEDAEYLFDKFVATL